MQCFKTLGMYRSGLIAKGKVDRHIMDILNSSSKINSSKIRFKTNISSTKQSILFSINSIEITPTLKRHLSRGVPLSGVTQHIPPPSVPDHMASSVVTNSLAIDGFSFKFG